MGAITVTGPDGKAIATIIDADGANVGKIGTEDTLTELADKLGVAEAELKGLLDGVSIEGAQISLDELFKKIKIAKDVRGAADTETEVKSLLDEMDKLADAINKVKGKLEELEAGKKEGTEQQISALRDAKSILERKLQEAYQKAMAGGEVAGKDNLKSLSSYKNTYNLQTSEQEDQQTQSLYKSMTSSPTAQPAAPQSALAGKAQVGGGYGGPGFSYGTSASGPGYNMSAYMASSYAQDNIMSSWDTIGQNQLQGQKMMMLFFYFARMAMSGDLYAMYQFMKFITSVIAKDKALQNIGMATKIIELQERSRDATNAIVDADTKDTNKFMQDMEKNKADISSIATSQKLIADMLQEFAQVAESLTSVTKEMLSANGILLRKVSTWS